MTAEFFGSVRRYRRYVAVFLVTVNVSLSWRLDIEIKSYVYISSKVLQLIHPMQIQHSLQHV